MPQDKRPLKKPTHPQTANGRFSWQVEYGCGTVKGTVKLAGYSNDGIYIEVNRFGLEHLCHKINGHWKNPPTHKRPMAVSRGKLSMDVTHKEMSGLATVYNGYIPSKYKLKYI